MNPQTIGNNIRSLREEAGLTQTRLAEVLHVTFQTVSKWETGQSYPDVAMLPEIAGHFGVSLDHLFRDNSSAYKNKAQRLMSMYALNTDDMELYEKAHREFARMTDPDSSDHFCWAVLWELGMEYHRRQAEAHYIAAQDGSDKSRQQYILFLAHQDRREEALALAQIPADRILALQALKETEAAYREGLEALNATPNDPVLMDLMGDVCHKLGRDEEAETYWTRVLAQDPDFMDAAYACAELYLQREDTANAKVTLELIGSWNKEHGFTVENAWVRAKLQELE